jgi:photosynthetic reaction center H subunit
MQTGALTAYLDVAQITLYGFWIFFAGLIWYIRQEDRREGYPLENDVTGEYNRDPWLFVPAPKTFKLPHGRGAVSVPDLERRDTRKIAGERTARAPGSPLVPVGDPLLAGVGPGSWAERADLPDLTAGGANKIVPLRLDGEFYLASEDPDPRGMEVVGCDGEVAGTVSDVWIDRSEYLIRYLEVSLGKGAKARSVLLPVNFTVFRNGHAYVHAITAAQFAKVPGTKSPDSITMLEEEKVTAYYGAGTLYANEKRAEPLV